jgi:hypothetical protein
MVPGPRAEVVAGRRAQEGTDLLSLGVTVGQGVGLLTEIRPAAEVLALLTAQLLDAVAAMPAAAPAARL